MEFDNAVVRNFLATRQFLADRSHTEPRFVGWAGEIPGNSTESPCESTFSQNQISSEQLLHRNYLKVSGFQ